MMRHLATLTIGMALLCGAAAEPVKPFDTRSLAQIEAAHRGKPFIVLVWSMDCEFCQASLDVLARTRTAKGALPLVTVTTDPVADQILTTQVERRLSSIGLQADSWGFGGDSPERLRFAIDPAWRGEKPRSYWYDAKGKRIAFSGLIKPAKVEQWLNATR